MRLAQLWVSLVQGLPGCCRTMHVLISNIHKCAAICIPAHPTIHNVAMGLQPACSAAEYRVQIWPSIAEVLEEHL